jgi:hypothetical protein
LTNFSYFLFFSFTSLPSFLCLDGGEIDSGIAIDWKDGNGKEAKAREEVWRKEGSDEKSQEYKPLEISSSML